MLNVVFNKLDSEIWGLVIVPPKLTFVFSFVPFQLEKSQSCHTRCLSVTFVIVKQNSICVYFSLTCHYNCCLC